jgi:hypothetical protein
MLGTFEYRKAQFVRVSLSFGLDALFAMKPAASA